MNTQPVLISGLPGKMATLVTLALLEDDRFFVVPYTLVGPETSDIILHVSGPAGNVSFQTIRISRQREASLVALKIAFPDLIIVDFTEPLSVNVNAELFCKVGIPFVMGTTGGDRKALLRAVKESGVPAVVSPNMSPAIVLFLAMIEYAAATYPGALKDFSIEIVESHQAGKKDKSGTANKVGELFKELGVDYRGEDSIRAIRDKKDQLALGVPAEYLDGHGWHRYRLVSPDERVELGFSHNVNGRQTYVDGTKRCLLFIAQKVREIAINPLIGQKGVCYSMINVLKEPSA